MRVNNLLKVISIEKVAPPGLVPATRLKLPFRIVMKFQELETTRSYLLLPDTNLVYSRSILVIEFERHGLLVSDALDSSRSLNDGSATVGHQETFAGESTMLERLEWILH